MTPRPEQATVRVGNNSPPPPPTGRPDLRGSCRHPPVREPTARSADDELVTDRRSELPGPNPNETGESMSTVLETDRNRIDDRRRHDGNILP
ncbi:hypothetical protein [Natrialba chahannaoensis]|uniref:hypothetical protein n=1 Tax=Natrialba chahannaoensis TaxID=68911 RepID=UPI0006776EC5|nr:hypothetical protein [Natrialba chahannaoensis]